MPNMKSYINGHNKQILQPEVDNQLERTCNCTTRANCPLQNKCLVSSVIYEGTIHAYNQQDKCYIGLCESTFKKRYAGHKTTFTNPKYRHSTTLSTEFWRLKEAGLNPQVTWKIVEKSKAFNPEAKKCQLCIAEKYQIANNNKSLINKKSEIISKCRHRRKFELQRFGNPD